jgi:hypothetical protein
MNNLVTTADAIVFLAPNAEFTINDGVIDWINPSVPPITQAKINEAKETLSAKSVFDICKEQAINLLKLTDWATLSDLTNASPKLLNQDEFLSYRQTVRLFVVNPVAEPSWPTIPKAQWG